MQSSTIGSKTPVSSSSTSFATPGVTTLTVPSVRPVSSTTSRPIELKGVVLVLGGRRQRVALDLELRAALDVPVELDHRPAGRGAVPDDLDRARRRRGSARRSSTSAGPHSLARRRTIRRGRAGGRLARSAPSRAAALQPRDRLVARRPRRAGSRRRTPERAARRSPASRRRPARRRTASAGTPARRPRRASRTRRPRLRTASRPSPR